MDTVLLNQILPAIVFSVFSIGFVGIWLHYRKLKSALAFSLSYAFGALAFAIEAAWPAAHHSVIRAVGDIGYIGSAALFPLAVSCRFSKRLPWAPVLFVAALGIFAALYYRFFDPSMAGRIQSVSIAVSLLMGIAAVDILAHARRPIDKITFWLTTAFAILILLNIIVHSQYLGALMTVDNLRFSSFMAAVNLLVSVLAPAIAVSIFVSYGMVIIRELENNSQRDPVTGLLNTRGFTVRAAELLEMCTNEARDVSIIIANVDRFHAFNARFGVPVADQLMQDTAVLIRELAGSHALCGKGMDGSICALIPDLDEADAAQIALEMHGVTRRQGISAIVKQSDAPAPNAPIMTITYGVGQLRLGEPFERLYSRTHAALCLGKQKGGDGVFRASGRPNSDTLHANGQDRSGGASITAIQGST